MPMVLWLVVALALFALGNWIGEEFFGGLGLLVLIPPVIGIVFGLGGAVRVTSERLFPDAPGFRRITWGALTLTLACVLPFVGWFALLPFLCLLGLGAFILSFFRSNRDRPGAVELDVDDMD